MWTSQIKVVRVHLPLKQGLRLVGVLKDNKFAILVRVHHPLQQGLRPHLAVTERCLKSASASSITTRIKTM